MPRNERPRYEWRRWSQVGAISEEIWTRLRTIPTTSMGGYPASASLRDGTSAPCILFFEVGSACQSEYVPRQGLFRVFYRHQIDKLTEPETVASVAPCSCAIPHAVASRMDSFPEPFMSGPSICKLIMNDESEFLFEGGWDHAFMSLPDGRTVDQIKDVVEIPSMNEFLESARDRKVIGEPHFALCMFRRPSSE